MSVPQMQRPEIRGRGSRGKAGAALERDQERGGNDGDESRSDPARPSTSVEERVPLVRDGVQRMQKCLMLAATDSKDGVGNLDHLLGPVGEPHGP